MPAPESDPTKMDLSTTCPNCQAKIQPAEIVRPRMDVVLCPVCGTEFSPLAGKKPYMTS